MSERRGIEQKEREGRGIELEEREKGERGENEYLLGCRLDKSHRSGLQGA